MKPGQAKQRASGPRTRFSEAESRAVSADRPSQAAAFDLLAIIHRLSQPLTALRGAIELGLLAEGSDRDLLAALKESLARADDLAGLLAALRDLVEADEASERPVTLRFEAPVQEAVQDLRPLAETKHVVLALCRKAELPVRANADWLRKAVFKLVQRAIERSPTSRRVQISVSRLERSACLEVSDEGSPFRAGELDHLNQPTPLGILFSEASKRGTLEWAIAKRVFEAIGGAVRVESKAGAGGLFRASLPLAST